MTESTKKSEEIIPKESKEDSENNSDDDDEQNDIISPIPPKILFNKLLSAIDKGATTNEIRQDPIKYLSSGKKKEIIINGYYKGIVLTEEILREMISYGDKLACLIFKNDDFVKDNNNKYYHLDFKDKRSYCWPDNDYPHYSEISNRVYDRDNKSLIQIIKDGKLNKSGGYNKLIVMEVYEEPYMHQIKNEETDDGCATGEYIVGYHKEIAKIVF